MTPGTVGNLATGFTGSAPLVIPDNDLVANARPLTSFPVTSTVTNAQNASISASDLPHQCAWNSSGTAIAPRVGAHTLWWSVTPEFDALLDLDTLLSTVPFTDTIMTVYSGAPGAFTVVACNDDETLAGTSLRSQLVDVPLEGGETYRVYVSRWGATPTTTVGTVVLRADLTVVPAVSIEPTAVSVSEDGITDWYSVRLTTAPSADVNVSIASDDECDTDQSALIFTSSNWAVPQVVTVSATADADSAEGAHICTIDHTASSADVAYGALAVPSVVATVEDAISTAITITSPADGSSVQRGTALTADFACTDNKAGAAIVSCVGTVADGAAVDTSTDGAKSFTVTLTDTLGRETTLTHQYSVTAPPPIPLARPDARIRKGTRGTFLGNDVYNTTTGQTARGAARRGRTVTFQVSLQNDAAFSDRFTVTGQRSRNGYSVRYLDRAGTDITAAVVAGTHRTGSIAPGKAVTITVKVTVRRSAATGSSITGTVAARSTTQTTRTDAVRFVARRR